MYFSLNEIEALGKRAARGAGLPWGVAEEAGKAVRWLSARDLPGADALAELLCRHDGGSYPELAPESTADRIWRPRSNSAELCPLLSGAALCDRAAEIAAGRTIVLGPTARPLLLAPFAAGAAEIADTAIRLSWAGAALLLTPPALIIEDDSAALTADSAERIECRRLTGTPGGSPRGVRICHRDIDAATWDRLNVFATRTYAPATEASRLAGAGAGLKDND